MPSEWAESLGGWLPESWHVVTDRSDVRALLVVAVAIVVAKVVEWVICRGVMALTRKTETELDDVVVDRLRNPIFLSVLVAGLFQACEVLGLHGSPRFWVRGILGTLLVLVWSRALLGIGREVLSALARNSRRFTWIDGRMVPLFDNLAKLVVVGAAVYSLLKVWALDVRPWLTSAGIVGIAVGFAAKDTLANLFSGAFILADRPYKIDDYIVLDSGERGRVTAIGLRSTRLLTRDDIEVTVPNAVIANAKIVNESGGPYTKARVTMRVGVAYGSDVDHVREVLRECATSLDGVCVDPAPRVRFTEFGDSSLLFRLLCWIEEPASRGAVLDELHTTVYRRFGQEGIEIPFPQRVVHVARGADGSGDAAPI